MKTVKEVTRGQRIQESPYYWDILQDTGAGAWQVSLPPDLKVYESELEALLGKVFCERARMPENFPLAQQMSLNWCVSKCREVGISFEESLMTPPSER